VSSASSASAGPSAAAIAAICGAEVLGLAGYSTVPALLPQFIEAWSLTNTQAGWLAGIVSAGYMLAVVPLVSLTDRQPPRQIYLASSLLSALCCFGVALSDSLLPALGFRALAGIALAGMYMPGLQALTHEVEGTRRARIAAWYTSSFTIGASLSFLLGRVGTLLGWRSAFVLAFCAADQTGVPAQAWTVLAVGALISFLGVPAGLLGNELSIRYGLRHIAFVIFLLSALTGGLFGFAAVLPYIPVLCLSIVVGFIVQGNFSNLTSGVLAVAAARHRGATIGVYSCVGFGGGFLGTLLFGVTLDQFGGTAQLGAWIMSFGTCGLACLAGAAATIFLSRDIWQPRA